MCPNRSSRAKTWLHLLGAAFLLSAPAARAIPALGYSGNMEGPSVTIEGSTGARCSSRSGTSPSIYGNGYSTDESDYGVSIGFILPLHPSSPGDCGKILRYEEGVVRLQIATRMLEQGLITAEEFKAIANELHEIIKPQ